MRLGLGLEGWEKWKRRSFYRILALFVLREVRRNELSCVSLENNPCKGKGVVFDLLLACGRESHEL
jgi:hypothetical protein